MSQEEEVKVLRQALEDIANPLQRIQREAREAGGKVNGTLTVLLMGDPSFYRKIAQDALQAVKKD